MIQNDFCDWLTLSGPAMWEEGRRPPDRFVEEYLETSDGRESEWCRPAKQQMITRSPDGSASTKLMFRYVPSDVAEDLANRLKATGRFWLDGNMGRLWRSDNLFGHDVIRSAWLGLDLLAKHGLRLLSSPSVSRVDLTRNFSFHSARDLQDYLTWASGMKIGRAVPTVYPSGVTWVTDDWSAKFYKKGDDLRRHKQSTLADQVEESLGYVLRFEITLRTARLKKMNILTLIDCENLDISAVLDEYLSPFSTGSRPALPDQLFHVKPRVASALLAWRDGYDFMAAMRDGLLSKATFYRLRKDVLALGYDIALPAVDIRFPVSIREVVPSVTAVPQWYRDRSSVRAA
jgi:hypothetical protein